MYAIHVSLPISVTPLPGPDRSLSISNTSQKMEAVRITLNKILKSALPLMTLLALGSCSSQSGERNVETNGSTHETAAVNEIAEDQVMGQTIYVPTYSHIYTRDKNRVINLAVTLSIRNTDAQSPILVTSAKYYDTRGAVVRDYIAKPVRLGPMASTDFVVADGDTSGGSGANFIVEWSSAAVVSDPVVEAVMISTAQQQGISFISTGRVIKDRRHNGASK